MNKVVLGKNKIKIAYFLPSTIFQEGLAVHCRVCVVCVQGPVSNSKHNHTTVN